MEGEQWKRFEHEVYDCIPSHQVEGEQEELLAGVEAYQPLLRDAPGLLRMHEYAARQFRDRTNFDGAN